MCINRGCVYCGATTDLTDDHPVPKGLFPKPRPKNLITVPACNACNQSYKLDDEYFRTAMVTPAYDIPLGRKMWDEKVVGSTLKRSPRLRSDLASRIVEREVTTPAGLILGTQTAVGFDRIRVDRVVEKIVRGLYFRHQHSRLSSDVDISIYADAALLRHLQDLIPHTVYHSIGDGSVFEYRYGIAREAPDHSFWAMRFFRTTVFVAFTGLPHSPKQRIAAATRQAERAVLLKSDRTRRKT